MKLAMMVLGDLIFCESFLTPQEAQSGFVVPRIDLKSAEWQRGAKVICAAPRETGLHLLLNEQGQRR